MATFVEIQSSDDQLVWVNPLQVRYLRASGVKTLLHFDRGDPPLLNEPVANVLELLGSEPH